MDLKLQVLQIQHVNVSYSRFCTFYILRILSVASLVKTIVDSGGIAVADNNSVSEGQKIIDTAINSFGLIISFLH